MKLTAFFLLASTASAASIRGLTQCSSVPTDQYCHLLDGKSLMALNIASGSKAPGASAVQWEELADTHDNWRMEPASEGHYHLIAEHSGLGLHAEGGWWGANVMQSEVSDEWCFEDQGNGYYAVKNKNNGLYLDTVNESHGANVVLASDNGMARSNQHWRLHCFKSTTPQNDECESLPEGYCHIVAKNSQQALNVDGYSFDDMANVQMYWETDAENDNWKFEGTSDGYYQIIAQHSGKGLHADGDEKGGNIVQSDMKDEWCFIQDRHTEYYQIKNRRNGLGLDVYKLGADAGTNVIQWPYGDGQSNRLFKLKCEDSNNSEPELDADGCGRLEGCYLRNLKTGEEQLLDSSADAVNDYTVSYGAQHDYTRYSIRCDTTGNMDQVDFFFQSSIGQKRHEEWGMPWWMEGDHGNYIVPVDNLVDTAQCGQTMDVRVNGKTWGDGDCFNTLLTVRMNCID